MNKVETRTIRDAMERFMPDTELRLAVVKGNGKDRPDFVAVKVLLPMQSVDKEQLYFFVAKRSTERRFSILIPVESVGIRAVSTALVILQDVLRTYNLILTQEAVIMEQDLALPFHKRMTKMAQAVVAIDGIRRLWKTQLRSNNAEGQDSKSVGNSANDRPSR